MPRVEPVSHAGSDFVISINFSGVAAPRLYFRAVGDGGWLVFNVSLANGSCAVPGTFLSEGLYEYYFDDESGGLRFPDADATFRIGLSRGNAAVYDKAERLVASDPLDPAYCAPWSSDYTCGYENMQGLMISAFSGAFFMTGNVSFENKSTKLIESKVDEFDVYDTCDHVDSDFDCNNANFGDLNPVIPRGAVRQASMMHALWNKYRLGGNSTVRELAVNYTNGSAENCDVWDITPDYDCDNADDQGFMIYSYFEAYELTGDVNYKQIAIDMASYGSKYSNSDFLMLGFFKAYELTGNESYRVKAVNLSLERIDACRYGECDVYNQSISAFAMWTAYEQTSDYRYKLSAYDKTMHNFSGSCNPWNDTFSCQNPLEQGAIIEAFFKAYQLLEAENATFYSHSVSANPRVSLPVTINVSFGGILRYPSIWYKRVGYSSWRSSSVSLQEESCTIPSSHIQNPGVYEYYFYDNDSEVRYPENGGTFKLALSLGNDTFRLIAQNFSGSDPTKNLCRPFSNDFSCNYETQQGPMIYGYSNAYFSAGNVNYSMIAENFTKDEIDASDQFFAGVDQFATCDYSDFDFDCSTVSPLDSVPAPLRQGWMIYSLWDAYQKTRDSAIKKVALDYSFGSSDMCDVWNTTPDYDCGNGDEQGLMMLAYFKAYEQSGNDVFRGVAENLSFVGVGMNDSDYLIMGLFSAFDITGNSTYYDKAINITDSRLGYCVESGCSALNFSVSALSAWAAYEHTETKFYMDNAVNKTIHSPVGSCDPWDAVPDYNCEYPDEQGTMMSLYWMADQAYTDTLSGDSLNVDLDGPASVVVGDSFDVGCFVENNGSNVLYNVNISVYFDSSLNTSDNVSYFYDNLSVFESKVLNWTFMSNETGDTFLSCNVTSDAVNKSYFKVVTVNSSITSLNVSLDGPSSVVVGDGFDVGCFVENNGSNVLYNVNVSVYFDSGLGTTDNISYFYDNLSVFENKSLKWMFLATSTGSKFVGCNVTADAVNGSDYKFVNVDAAPPAKLPGGSSSSSTVSSDDSGSVFYGEYYSYFDLNNSSHFFDLISDDMLLADSIRENRGIDDGFAEISETSSDIVSCYNVSRTFESNGSRSKIGLSILYFCSNTTESLLVYDTIPEAFANSPEMVSIELSRDGGVFVLEDNISYLFVFNNVCQNELIFVNYTVDESIMYNLLDYIERPYIFGDRSGENASDVVAPLVTIIFPVNGSNVASGVFDLIVGYYDESDVSCEYSLDDMGPVGMEDNLLSEMFSVVNTSLGYHYIVVHCVDFFGNRNSSLVVFYVGVADGNVIRVNDSSLAVDGDMWLGQDWLVQDAFFIFKFLFFMILLVLIFYYLDRQGYVLYFLLRGLLGVMYLLNRKGYVFYALKFYPVVQRFYGALDVNPALKGGSDLHRSINRVVRVLELYAVTNKTYDSVVKNDTGVVGLEDSLVSIKRLYDEVVGGSLASAKFLEQVRDRYIYCMDYLIRRVSG